MAQKNQPKQMSKEEALNIVTTATSQLNANRETHIAIITALQVLNDTIGGTLQAQVTEQTEQAEKRKVSPFKKITEPAK